MSDTQLKKILFGTMLAGGMVAGASGCSPKESDNKDQEKPETEVTVDGVTKKHVNDPYGNIALFEASRSKIKFALAVVENYYPYTYKDGNGNWTTGEGLTELYNENGKMTKVTKNTHPVTMTESDMYKGRYLTYSILPKIKTGFKVPADENTLIAVTVLGYCVGPKWIANSEFTKQLNAGAKGAELAAYLAGFCQDAGVPKRMYFFAALVAGKLQWSDLLDLRAEGCYNLTWQDIFVCDKNGRPIKKNKYRQWDFSKLQKNLEKAKSPKSTKLHLKDNKTVVVKCELAKKIVPNYIWQEISNGTATDTKTIEFADAVEMYSCDAQNDSSYIAYNNGRYETALESGMRALDLAQTDKQRGAANYNIGITYLAMEKYEKAVKYLRLSLAANKTKACEDALATAMQKRQSQHNKMVGYGLLGAIALTGGLVARRRFIAKQQSKHR